MEVVQAQANHPVLQYQIATGTLMATIATTKVTPELHIHHQHILIPRILRVRLANGGIRQQAVVRALQLPIRRIRHTLQRIHILQHRLVHLASGGIRQRVPVSQYM